MNFDLPKSGCGWKLLCRSTRHLFVEIAGF